MAKVKELTRKITAEELETLQKSVNGINQIQMQIGGIELQKNEMIQNLNVLRAGLQEQQNKLTETYGDVNVSLADGTITDADNS